MIGHTRCTHSYLLTGADQPECITCQCPLTVTVEKFVIFSDALSSVQAIYCFNILCINLLKNTQFRKSKEKPSSCRYYWKWEGQFRCKRWPSLSVTALKSPLEDGCGERAYGWCLPVFSRHDCLQDLLGTLRCAPGLLSTLATHS